MYDRELTEDEERDQRRDAAPTMTAVPPMAQRALAMQRAVGNQATGAILARDPLQLLPPRRPTASGLPASLDPASVVGNMREAQSRERPQVERAIETVFSRYGHVAGMHGQTALSIAELVDIVRREAGDVQAFQPNDIAAMLRERFRQGGMPIREHRDAGDEEGRRREAEAAIRNEASGGGLSDAHVSMAGGAVRLSLSGVTIGNRRNNVTVTGGPGGVEASGSFGGGRTEVGVEAGPEGFGFELSHETDSIRFNGNIEVSPARGDGRATWNASITIGTPHAPDPAALARIVRQIEESMRDAAEQAEEHGQRLTRAQLQSQLTTAKAALEQLQEEAERMREGSGPQASVSLRAGGDEHGGVSGMVVFTLTF